MNTIFDVTISDTVQSEESTPFIVFMNKSSPALSNAHFLTLIYMFEEKLY